MLLIDLLDVCGAIALGGVMPITTALLGLEGLGIVLTASWTDRVGYRLDETTAFFFGPRPEVLTS
jgi:hypothetical protein